MFIPYSDQIKIYHPSLIVVRNCFGVADFATSAGDAVTSWLRNASKWGWDGAAATVTQTNTDTTHHNNVLKTIGLSSTMDVFK